MNIQTHYNKNKRVGEEFKTDSKTEPTGWMPVKLQVESLIKAGMNLRNYRMETYDFRSAEEIDDGFFNPVNVPNYDMVDASNDLDELIDGVKKRRRERDVQKKHEEKKEVLRDDEGKEVSEE